MSVQFEIDWPLFGRWWQWKPGIHRSWLGDRRYTRIWWLCFAVTFWPGRVDEFGDAIRMSEWKDTE